jgi:hypothetical protein
MRYHAITKKEVNKFCEDNFVEEIDWLWAFVSKVRLATIEMDEQDTLIVKIKA